MKRRLWSEPLVANIPHQLRGVAFGQGQPALRFGHDIVGLRSAFFFDDAGNLFCNQR